MPAMFVLFITFLMSVLSFLVEMDFKTINAYFLYCSYEYVFLSHFLASNKTAL